MDAVQEQPQNVGLRQRFWHIRRDIWLFIALMSVMGSYIIVTYTAFLDVRISIVALCVVYICDIIYVIDVTYRIKLFHQLKSKVYLSCCDKVARSFLFVVDLVSLLPLEALVLIINLTPKTKDQYYLQMFAWYKLNRVLRLYHIVKYYTGKTHELRLNLYRREIFALVVCSFCFLLAVFHGVSCLWYTISCEPIWRNKGPLCKKDDLNYNQSKIATFFDTHPYYSHIDRATGDSFGWYVANLHWTVMSLRNSGNRYIPPSYWVDLLISSIIMFFGCVMCMVITAILIYILSEMDLRRSIFFHEAYSVKSFVKHFEMSEYVADFSDECFNFMWERKRGYSDHYMKMILPKSVQTELGMCMVHPMIEASEVLKHFPVDGLQSISLASNLKHYFSNEFLIRPNTMVHTAFYIVAGKVEVLSEIDGLTPILVLGKGSLIGEINLLYPRVRKHGVKTRTPCDIITLNSSFLTQLLTKYPQIERKIRAQLRARVSWIKTKNIVEQETDDEVSTMNKFQKAMAVAKTAKRWKTKSKLGSGKMSTVSMVPSSMSTAVTSKGQEKTSLTTGTQFMSVLTWLNFSQALIDKNAPRHNNYPQMYEKLQHKNRNLSSNGMYAVAELEYEPNYYWRKVKISKASRVYQIWSSFVLLVIVFNLFAHPYQLVVNSVTFAFWVDVIVDTVYGLNLVFILFVFIEVEEMNSELTWWSHLKTELVNPGIVLDVLPVFPVHLIAWALLRDWRIRHTARVLIYLKFVKIILFFNKLENDVRVKIFTIRFFKSFVYLSTYVFNLACYFTALGCRGDPDCLANDTWIPTDGLERYDFDPKQDSVFLLALYWATCTTFGIGFNDIDLRSREETGAHSVGLLLGFCLLSYFYADLTSTLSGAMENEINHQDNVVWLTRYLDDALIDLRLIDRVNLYLNVQWEVLRGISSETHRSIGFLTVSHSMYTELVVDYVADYLYRTHLFRHIDTDTMRKFCLSAKLAVVPPNEMILASGDFVRRMYVIRRGYVEVFLGDSTRPASYLTSGHSFGEINMLFGFPSQVSIVSLTFLEVIVIDSANFERILVTSRYFSEAVEALRNDIGGLWRFQKSVISPRGAHGHEGGGHRQSIKQKMLPRRFLQPPASSTYVYRKTIKNSRGEIIHLRKLGMDPYTREFRKLKCCRCIRYFFMPLTFLPKGRFIRCWELVRVVFIITCAVLVPTIEAFPGLKNDYELLIYIFDLVALVDMFIRLHTAYHNTTTNEVITHPLLATKNYLKTAFLSDFLSSVFVYVAINESLKDTRYESTSWAFVLKCNRLIQMYRVFQYYRRNDCKIVKGKNTWRIFKLLPLLLYQTHFLACITAVSSCPATQSNPSPIPRCIKQTWIGNSTAPALNSRQITDVDIYIISFYYTASSSMGCGFGDYFPYTEAERTTIGILFFLYLFLRAYIIANIIGSKCHLDHKLLGYQKQMTYLVGFLGREKLDSRLSGRIIRYYDYQWRRTQGIEPQKLFANLFPSLRKEVAMDVFEYVMRQLPAFKQAPNSFLRTICVYLTPIYFLRHDVIVQKGDVCDYIYFISRGKVVQWTEHGEITLDVGDYIGTMDVTSVRPAYRYTASAYTNVDIFSIRRKDFVRTVNFFPNIARSFSETHREHSDENENTQTLAPSTTDRSLIEVNSELVGTSNSRDSSIANRKPSSLENLRMSFSNVVTYLLNPIREDNQAFDEDYMYQSSVLPESRTHRYLDIATFAAAVISSSFVTYQTCFKDYDNWFYVIAYATDIVYWTKIYLSFRISFFDESGEIVTDSAEIQNKYLSDYHGFALDFISSFPLEIFVGASLLQENRKIENSHLWGLLRLNRLLRLIHVWAFFEGRTNSLIRSLLRTKVERIICFTLLYFHFVACILYGVSSRGDFIPSEKCPPPVLPYQQKWRCANPARWFQTKRGEEPFESHAYIWSLYFVLSTFTTTAYGDLLPVTYFEMLLVSLLAFSSILWFGLVLSDLLSGLQNTIDTSYHLAADVVLKLYKDYGVSRNILRKVARYFTYAWAENQGVVIPEFLMRAPACLKMDIYARCYGDHLRSNYLFKNLPEEFIRQASIRLRHFWVLGGDYVIRQNEIDSSLYFIHKGYIEYTQEALEDDHAVADLGYLGRSALIGEVQCLIEAMPHEYSYKAQVNLDVLSLTPGDMQELFELFPQHKQTLIDRVVEKRADDALAAAKSKYDWMDSEKTNMMLSQWRVKKNVFRQAEDELIGDMDNFELND